MFRLLYVSNTDRYIDPQEVADILAISRANNSRLGITGMLLHLDGAFMQILEGDRDAVIALYEAILGDRRHWNAQILLQREGPQVFKEWSMGFQKLSSEEAQRVGAFAISRAAFDRKIDPEQSVELMTLMQTFYRVQTSAELPSAL